MKKIMMRFLTLMILSMALLTACSSDTKKFYHEYSFLPVRHNQSAEPWEPEVTIIEPSNEQIQIVEEVFQKLRNVYQQNLAEPQVVFIEPFWTDVGAYQGKAFYNPSDNKIYLLESFSKEDVPVLAHETMHYFCYNANEDGMTYLSEDKSLLLGVALNEGIANYFSTKVYPFPEDMSTYEYETHVAEMLSLLMGEEELKDAFFSSDISKIKEAVVSKISPTYGGETFENEYISKQEFDCFDVLIVSLDSYYVYLGFVGQIQGVEYLVFDMAESVEETLMKALEEADKLEEGQKALAQMIENQNHIDWQGTNLPQLLK